MILIYRAWGPCGQESILTTEKPDDVGKPCGYIEGGFYKPFGLLGNKEVYLNPFTNRWE